MLFEYGAYRRQCEDSNDQVRSKCVSQELVIEQEVDEEARRAYHIPLYHGIRLHACILGVSTVILKMAKTRISLLRSIGHSMSSFAKLPT